MSLLQSKTRGSKSRKKRIKTKSHRYKPTPSHEEEDWDKEVEEFSQRMATNGPSSDLESNLCADEVEKAMACSVQDQGSYVPAVHHSSPVKWIRLAHHVVADQFADALE